MSAHAVTSCLKELQKQITEGNRLNAFLNEQLALTEQEHIVNMLTAKELIIMQENAEQMVSAQLAIDKRKFDIDKFAFNKQKAALDAQLQRYDKANAALADREQNCVYYEKDQVTFVAEYKPTILKLQAIIAEAKNAEIKTPNFVVNGEFAAKRDATVGPAITLLKKFLKERKDDL